jgi:hypothetical protein
VSNGGVIRSRRKKAARPRRKVAVPRPAFKSLHALKAVNVAGIPYYDYKDLGGLNAGDKFQRKAQEALCGGGWSPVGPGTSRPLPIGTILRLEREPNNPKDAMAIVIVEEATEQKIGYIPRTQNPTLARLMDAGYPLFAAVLEHNYAVPISNFERLTVAIYIEKARAK